MRLLFVVVGGGRVLVSNEGGSEQSQDSGRECVDFSSIVSCKIRYMVKDKWWGCVPPSKSRLSKPACGCDPDQLRHLPLTRLVSRSLTAPSDCQWL